MSEIQIKSELLKNEIIQYLTLLKEGKDIYPILRQMFCSMRKLDQLHENKLKDFDDILINDFMGEHSP